MNRIRIDLPGSLPFVTGIPLRITDINYGNHTGNQVFPELMHEARVRFLSSEGLGELSFEGTSLIMAGMAVEFKSELLYGDQVEVQVGIDTITRVGFDMVYLVNGQRNGQTFLAARAKTEMVCFDYKNKKVVAMPGKAVEIMKKYKF
jgi:acyl-CoA thioesterase FadM